MVKKISLITLTCTLLFLNACTTAQQSTAEYTPQIPETQDGFYRVKRGDNLYRIGLRFNQNVTTLKKWNNLPNENQLKEGQLLRVTSSNATTNKNPQTQNTANIQDTTNNQTTATNTSNNQEFIFPAQGTVINNFDGKNNKGIDISGSVGDPIIAVADGEVIYVGEEVKGYGKLILIKHANRILSTYAHNNRMLVQVGQKVKQGDKIAEMGRLPNGDAALHFELRRDSLAINPVNYLNKR
ncbi:MAG: peptidoglycan DD-metalloendopeptidase family protein [Neisseriaceae bacterium]|nr:peptidoglycan DD-metalloendopeptidase family protein [Neisseriaceae bacterium]